MLAAVQLPGSVSRLQRRCSCLSGLCRRQAWPAPGQPGNVQVPSLLRCRSRFRCRLTGPASSPMLSSGASSMRASSAARCLQRPTSTCRRALAAGLHRQGRPCVLARVCPTCTAAAAPVCAREVSTVGGRPAPAAAAPLGTHPSSPPCTHEVCLRGLHLGATADDLLLYVWLRPPPASCRAPARQPALPTLLARCRCCHSQRTSWCSSSPPAASMRGCPASTSPPCGASPLWPWTRARLCRPRRSTRCTGTALSGTPCVSRWCACAPAGPRPAACAAPHQRATAGHALTVEVVRQCPYSLPARSCGTRLCC